MNIHWRIIARKVLLIWFYQKLFSLKSLDNKHHTLPSDKIAKFLDQGVSNEVDNEFVAASITLQSLHLQDHMDDVTYILQHYFTDHDHSIVDYSYITAIAEVFEQEIPTVEKLVNTYAKSFQFKDMDVVDQIIFTLWYCEKKVFSTTREVLINEMVEIAKRYGDEASPKLINGIWHHIF